MSSSAFYNSLLRPPVLHILRAAGFTTTRPAVLDTVVDLAARYLTLLATKTASHALANHKDPTPTITDVRMALQDVGALWPQMSTMEEQCRDEEDLRGVEAFVGWMKGEGNHEIRRIAGLAVTPGEALDMAALEEREDFLTVLKKKHSKTSEESRFQGTLLGIPAEDKPIIVEGGQFEHLRAWEENIYTHGGGFSNQASVPDTSSAIVSSGSSPLSEI